jgi:hypothetical protein
MALIATTALGDSIEAVLAEIHKTSTTEKNLTPRSIESLKVTASQGDLILLKADEALAGWGIREQLQPGLKEVGLMFIKPEYRSALSFIVLARALSNTPDALILATYDPALIRQSVLKFGFREISLFQVVLKSGGKFITKRLNRSSRAAVSEHTRRAKPLFSFREKIK